MSRNLILAATTALAMLATPSLAHEKGRVKLASRQLSPGMALSISGEKFTKNASLAIYLVGLAGRVKVGEVRADASGKFDGSVTVPADAAAGSYRLVLQASDGDEAASIDVEVAAAGAQVAAQDEHAHHEAGAQGQPDEGQPSAEPLQLDRATSPAVRGGALAGVVVALAVGATLLRRPR